jgi:hypothetical protein
MKYLTKYGEVSLAVKIHGKQVKEYRHEDDNYIWAKRGTPYSIVVKNDTRKRMEVVLSVDGVDAISREDADYQRDGYVIEPLSTQSIPGFYVDGETAGRFTFGSTEESYAARTGRPRNVGVIGAAFFAEAEPVQITWLPEMPREQGYYGYNPAQGGGTYSTGGILRSGSTVPADCEVYYSSCCTDSPVASAGPSGPVGPKGAPGQEGPVCSVQSVGTVFGEETEFTTSCVSFNREWPQDSPLAVMEINYRTKEQLKEMGIEIYKKPRPKVARKPKAFPHRDSSRKPEFLYTAESPHIPVGVIREDGSIKA